MGKKKSIKIPLEIPGALIHNKKSKMRRWKKIIVSQKISEKKRLKRNPKKINKTVVFLMFFYSLSIKERW